MSDIVRIELEDGGIIRAELYEDIAPISAKNFKDLAEKDFYAGSIFHRVIPGFMIQGGASAKGEDAAPIKGEFASNGVKNDLKHTRGVLSMARTMVKDSGSSQFFIMHEDSPHLDGEYAAFGKVIEGLDVVDRIAAAPRDRSDRPHEDQVIKTIVIE
ncbi:MAG: peptidylprolyl isomerase [Clostridiales Family XIII bacterium]|jgi:peptidyl-prolyl cis-trans isomerase B (cyclophilin B)|nr:peptidylprolyl isomerase [Clostridiales Family XIII bacterium]